MLIFTTRFIVLAFIFSFWRIAACCGSVDPASLISDPRQLGVNEQARIGFSLPSGYFVNSECVVRDGGIYAISDLWYDLSNRRVFARTEGLSFQIPVLTGQSNLVLLRSGTVTRTPLLQQSVTLLGLYRNSDLYPKDTKSWNNISSRVSISISGPECKVFSIIFDVKSDGWMRIFDISKISVAPKAVTVSIPNIRLQDVNTYLRVMLVSGNSVVGYHAFSVDTDKLENENSLVKEARMTTAALKSVNASRADFDAAIVNGKKADLRFVQSELAKQEALYGKLINTQMEIINRELGSQGTLTSNADLRERAVAAYVSGRVTPQLRDAYTNYLSTSKALERQLDVLKNSASELVAGKGGVSSAEIQAASVVNPIKIPKVYEYVLAPSDVMIEK